MLKSLTIGTLKLTSNIFIAPLAGYTNLPTRRIYRAQGAGIAYAEMVSAEGLNYNYNKSVRLIDTDADDHPLGVQLFGANAERVLMAFERIRQEEFDLIDLNCGCSVKKIIKSACGASLLRDPEEIYRIIKGLHSLTDKPVTLKIRSGWDHSSINYTEVYQAAESGGAALITLHPRTKSMLFDGKADWSHITALKKISAIPVIGNGDIFTAEDAVKMFEETKCDGIMLARGVLENPFLVEEVIARLQGITYLPRTIEERFTAAKVHCKALIEYLDSEVKGMMEFRKFFRGYIKGLPDIAPLRQAVTTLVDFNEFAGTLDRYLEYQAARKA